ncbi:MAG: putative bifunctional diguanylate cyclase/phosphodiesterase [Burkholderiaceae bacterium]
MIAALVPTSLLAILTYGNITRVLEDQRKAELVEASRTYGLAIIGRLHLAHRMIESMAKNAEAGPLFPSGYSPIFEGVEYLNFNSAALDSAPSSALAIQPPASAQESAAVFILKPTGTADSNLLKAKLNPNYVWGERDEVSDAYNVCVYEGATRLHCEYPDEMSTPSSVQEGRWDLFLKPKFGAGTWTIVSTRRFAAAEAALSEFFSVYILVASISILLIMLLSLIQIRRTMVPLEKLMDGTRRIANGDYREIVVHSEDEFGKLTSAVNTMSNRIEQQLTTLRTLSAIDKEMRERLDLSQLIMMIGNAIRRAVPGAALYVAQHVNKNSEDGCLFAYAEGDTFVTKTAIRISVLETAWLAQQSKGVLNNPPSPFPHIGSDQRSWSIALQWQGTGCGMLTLIWEGPALNEQTIAELMELVNRIAVAVQMQDREQRLLYQARFDSLTGLLNRHGLEERIAQIMRHDAPAAVLFIDIDRFKLINDSFGHKTGDLLLQAIAARLLESIKAGTAARLGGDEFVLLLPGEDCPETVATVARGLMDVLNKPFAVASQQFLVTCSIGIAMHPSEAADGLTLIERADVAMYRAKQSGRDSYRFYSESMSIENSLRLELEADLRLALKRGELQLHYQPKVSVVTGAIMGAEALLRWAHPTQGLIPPARFISLAEETGLIVPIGLWVLRTACAQNAAWRRAGLKPVRISVNVSARQFAEPDFVGSVASILRETGLAADGLELELTESMIMNDVDHAIAILNAVRELGVTLSIDDFGTGYSSLAYLKRFPISALKIDRSFICGIADHPDDRLIIASIIGLAHNLQLQVVAEGVETAEQLDYLRQHGCDEIQGYYFSCPVETGQFIAVLEDKKCLLGNLPSPMG